MAREGIWQGLMDWWKPVDDPDSRETLDSLSTSAGASIPAAGASLPAAGASRPTSEWKVQEMAAERASIETRSASIEPSVETPEETHGVPREINLDGSGYGSDGDVSEAELEEFLAADEDPVEADPAFKRRLREQLWTMIRDDDLPRQ